jgi:hypothetical protein
MTDPHTLKLFTLALLASVVIIGLGITAIVRILTVTRADRERRARESIELRAAMETHKADHAAQLAELYRNIEILSAGMPQTDELLREGRLNLSARAQALQMLRAGISPDTAAQNLGIASRDVRLLARVSTVLSPR